MINFEFSFLIFHMVRFPLLSILIILNKPRKLATVLKTWGILELIIPYGNITKILPLHHTHMPRAAPSLNKSRIPSLPKNNSYLGGHC